MILTILAIYLLSVVYCHNFFIYNKLLVRRIMMKDVKDDDEAEIKIINIFFENYYRNMKIISHIPIWNICQVLLFKFIKKNTNK